MRKFVGKSGATPGASCLLETASPILISFVRCAHRAFLDTLSTSSHFSCAHPDLGSPRIPRQAPPILISFVRGAPRAFLDKLPLFMRAPRSWLPAHSSTSSPDLDIFCARRSPRIPRQAPTFHARTPILAPRAFLDKLPDLDIFCARRSPRIPRHALPKLLLFMRAPRSWLPAHSS